MINNAFAQLTDAEKERKFDIAIRNHTDNLLTADTIKGLVQGISTSRQYSITVHRVDRKNCEALLVENTLHIFIPEHVITNERLWINGKV